MRQTDDLLDRFLLVLVTRVPGPAVVFLTLLLYPGLGLVVPLVFGWSASALAVTNLLGTLTAALIALSWLSVVAARSRRRQLVEWTTDLRRLNAEEFEWLVGEVYRREGWHVQETGSQEKPDGNVDLRLSRDGQRLLVQCKRWGARKVGVNEVRNFVGTLTREGLPPSNGVFVTLSDFREQARAEATATGLVLMDGTQLYSRIEKVRQAEPCPLCMAPMRVDHSTHGWWLRCTAPGCRGKRDLARDPGRAVDLLTASL
jgi:hypothetical protein